MLDCKEIVFSGHAIQRMFERGIQKNDVKIVLQTSEIIQRYPDDTPYPSFLISGRLNAIPLHLVIGMNETSRRCIVITVYIPSLNYWMEDYKTRRIL